MRLLFLRTLFLFLLPLLPCFSQTATLRGVVSDETGAIIPGAKVFLVGHNEKSQVKTAGNNAIYTFAGLIPGEYTVSAAAPEMALASFKVTLKSGVQSIDLKLKVMAASQKVTVNDSTSGVTVGTDPSSNAGALVLRGQDLEALADNPEDLAADLAALAGPSAGPNGGAIFIDGFSGGQLPSKDSIREIRINQNPFSPEYDKVGFGRIEIFTKPGSDKFRGTVFYNIGVDTLNSRNPYAARKAPFLVQEGGGNISGPLGKRASFFLDIQEHAIDNGAIINGVTLDPATLAIIDPYSNVLTIPQRRFMLNPRFDYQINQKNTLTARYAYSAADVQDSGVGGLNLVSRGVHANDKNHTIQLTETAVLGASVVNETRFQYLRLDGSRVSKDLSQAVQVLGAFNGGGAQTGVIIGQDNYEVQNYTSIARGKHTWRFGVRLRTERMLNDSSSNFGGTFTFSGNGSLSSIENYQRTLQLQKAGFGWDQIRAQGIGASQFTINSGQTKLILNQVDAGVFAGDDFRWLSNITVSYGVRYEAQTNLGDHTNVAPRVGIAWAPGGGKGKSKTVIRAGFGMFYDRFALTNTLTGRRYDGMTQKQSVFVNPAFFLAIPSGGDFTSGDFVPPIPIQTIQQISGTLRSPYIMQSALGVERQLPHNTTLAVTYADAHGVHLLRSEAINAPIGGVYPLGNPAAVFLMGSSGIYNQRQLITNVTSKVNSSFTIFSYYVVNRAKSNTEGLGTFRANPSSDVGEYGPASTDIHQRVSFGGTLIPKYGVRLSPLLTMESGAPFDITAGRDIYGDTLFNGRPGFATNASRPGVVQTSYGLLDPNPTAEERLVSRNYGRGPGAILFNLRVAKTLTFGAAPEVGGPQATRLPGEPQRQGGGVFNSAATSSASSSGKRYSVVLQVSIRNLLNHNNPGPINGNITSPLFGRANQGAGAGVLGGTGFSEAANNRRLEFQIRFTF